MPKKKVLIIDDHAGIRFLLRSLVETDDFTVCGEAPNGTQGIEKAKEADPDLVLLDFSMPGINGAETAVILKRLKPHVPIVLFTMHEDCVGKALAAAMRVDRVIAKQDGMTKLLECMRELLGLGPRQSSVIGPLALPVDGSREANHVAPPALPTDEKPPE
jgi:DNA-binding NarL/FixJ family response regulator